MGRHLGRLRADDVVRQRVAQAAERKLPIVRVLLPGLGGAAAREAECLANLRLGETAVALEQFRAAHASRYPDSLSELTPEFLAGLPLDPFDGQPLRYRKTGGGHLLYSIGPDLKDDAGARRNGQGGDLIFEGNGLASSRP